MNRNLLFLIPALLGLMACSSEPEPAAAPVPKAAAQPARVLDYTSLFPAAGKVSATVVPDHLLGMKALPGGSLADYDVKGRKYQMFIIDTDTTQNAAFLMMDTKDQMAKGPEYLPHMGGYFGMYGDKPLYCFSKLHYVAGVLGLPKDLADPLAIKLAAQLN